MTGSTVNLDGQTIEISNRDKVLFPDAGVTKGDLIDYLPGLPPTSCPIIADVP